MLVHAVYIWLRPDMSERERDAHLDTLRALAAIETVRHFHLGIPADTDRPVIERGYAYALIVTFDDLAGLHAFRAHPLHEALKGEVAAFWKRQVVYDSTEEVSAAASR